MAIRLTPTNLVFGADAIDAESIVNLPADAQKVRLRIRPKCFAIAYVVTPTGIKAYHLERIGNRLKLSYSIGENRRLKL